MKVSAGNYFLKNIKTNKMNKVSHYLKLFRIQNLLIIALLLYFVRYFLLLPFYKHELLSLQVDNFSFFLFVLGYIILSAGGYAINDYYDIGIDEINKPEKTILRKQIPLSSGKYAYYITSSLGFIISLWAIFRIQAPKLIFILLIITFLYWFYATKYKREFLTGNLSIAFLAFMGVGIVWLYEFFAGIKTTIIPIQNFYLITNIVLAYAIFSFLLTFIREVIKDITDIEGDKEFDCDSIPIRYGIQKTKIVIYVAYFILFLGFIPVFQFLLKKEMSYLILYSFIVIGMLIFSLYKTFKAESKKEFSFISDFIKIVFLAGILSMQLFSISL